jgi:isoquinoline 1-oxidoreductase alpha subunit
MATFTINGSSRTFDGAPDMPLLWYLRDELGLTGTKFGCGEGLCGACTVHIDGQAMRSCQVPMSGVANRRIVTIEGLSADASYCQAGQIMQAAALLAETPRPTDAEIDAAMSGNICRCGTYQRIRAAIKRAAGGRS